MATDRRLTISELPFHVAVAAAEAIRCGANQPSFSFGSAIPSFMLDVTEVPGHRNALVGSGFQSVSIDTEQDQEFMVWLPEDLRLCWRHPHGCDCMDCRDVCCCGDFQRTHSGDHTFVSMYWYYKEKAKRRHENHETR